MWSSVGVGVSVHALSCFGLAYYGTDEQRAEWLPGMLERRPAGRLLPLRGARRLRPRGDAYDGPPRRRLLRHQRREGLDDARRPRRLLQGDGPHVRRPQRDLLLPRPGLRRGPERRPAGAQDGAHRLGHRDDALRQRPRRRLPPARRRGRGAADRARRARLRPPRHRRRRRGPGPGGARLRRRLRPRARDLRHPDHRPPGPGLRARRHGGRHRLRPRHDAPRRAAARRRAAVLARGVGRQAGRHRQRHEGHHRRRAGARRLRLHPRLPGRALHARGQGHADLRGHQPDPADGHLALAREGQQPGPSGRSLHPLVCCPPPVASDGGSACPSASHS